MENKIKEILSTKRYEHSINVANLAREMAEVLGADENAAYTAGVLHDIAKEMTRQELLDVVGSKGIKLSFVEENNTALLHAPVGAGLVQDMGYSKEIVDAVRYHTVGRAGMTLLEKIIYLADMIEPGRVFPEASILRKMWRDDFFGAFTKALEFSIMWNVSRNKLIDKGTVDAFNDMLLERMDK